MRNFSIHLIGTIVLSVLIVCIALGGGYQINEQGARAVGMGGAFVARASDPSAMYFNPAGLAFQKGFNILGGTSIILPSTKFKTVSGTETSTKSQVFTPVNLYGGYQLNDQFVVGIGVFNAYGLGTEWPDAWVGRTLAIKSDVQTWYINPTIAYKINDDLSVGLGVSYITGSVKMTRDVQTGATTFGSVALDGTGNGIGFNLGIIYKPADKLSLGLSYRTLTKLEFSGNANFTNMGGLAPYFPGGTGKATLPMPGDLFFGAAYEVTSDLTIEADIQFVQWSAYDKLDITISPITTHPLSHAQLQGPSSTPKNWIDGYLLRGGAEYKCSNDMTLRGGLILDLSPQPPSMSEPMLPDGDRVDVSLGVGYKINESLTLDAAYMVVLFMERDAKTSALPGTYNSNAHIFSVNIGYSF